MQPFQATVILMLAAITPQDLTLPWRSPLRRGFEDQSQCGSLCSRQRRWGKVRGREHLNHHVHIHWIALICLKCTSHHHQEKISDSQSKCTSIDCRCVASKEFNKRHVLEAAILCTWIGGSAFMRLPSSAGICVIGCGSAGGPRASGLGAA